MSFVEWSGAHRMLLVAMAITVKSKNIAVVSKVRPSL